MSGYQRGYDHGYDVGYSSGKSKAYFEVRNWDGTHGQCGCQPCQLVDHIKETLRAKQAPWGVEIPAVER